MKKTLRIVLSCILCLSFVLTLSGQAFAEEPASEDNLYKIYDSLEEATLALQEEANVNPRATGGLVTPLLIRSQTVPNRLQVYLHVTATEITNSLKYKNLEIWNESLLNREMLFAFSPDREIVLDYPGASMANVFLGFFSLAETYEYVRIDIDYLAVYFPNKLIWLSCTDPIGRWQIT